MKIGVLALQGAFIEHVNTLNALGYEAVTLSSPGDLSEHLEGIILPGGESTVQMKLLRESGMYERMKRMIENGIPTLATCAGLILLASSIENQAKTCFSTLPVTLKRNAYGRQTGSFKTKAYVSAVGEVKMTFIRAPYISQCSPDVEILSIVDSKIVAVKYLNQYGLSFHPELERVEDSEWIYTLVFGKNQKIKKNE